MLTAKDVVLQALTDTGALTGEKKVLSTTGFPHLDSEVGGIAAGEIMVIGSRPNVGKTAQLLHIANMAALQDKKPYFLSLEDSPTIIGERLTAPYSGIKLGSLRVDGHQYYRSSAIDALVKRRWEDVAFDFAAVRTLEVISQKIRDAVLIHGRDCILIDYLTKIFAPGFQDIRTMVVTVVNELRALSAELNVPLYIGAQLARPQWNKEANKYIQEPELSSLKEAGVIEEACDLIIMSWADDGVRYTKVVKNKYNSYKPTWEWEFSKQGGIKTHVISSGEE